jgi:L-iditol 2-dehydrogenase
MTEMPLTGNAEIYNPRKVLDHPDFKVLAPRHIAPKEANIAAFYNPNGEIHLVQKPRFKPGPGQVLVHVRATGICGQVLPMLLAFRDDNVTGRSDVHFWQHGRIGDSMVVTDEVCGSQCSELAY